MKDKLDHLLFCLGEECGEVQQVVGKAGRFGIYDINPITNEVNIDLMRNEIHDILSIWRMLCKSQCIDSSIDENKINKKIERVEHYMKYAIERGELNEIKIL